MRADTPDEFGGGTLTRPTRPLLFKGVSEAPLVKLATRGVFANFEWCRYCRNSHIGTKTVPTSEQLAIGFLALIALALADCRSTGPSPEAVANMNAQREKCQADFVKAVPRANCQNGVSERFLRGHVEGDLLDVLEATRLSLAEKQEAGLMTEADANLAFAKAKSEAESEQQRRRANASIADAQDRAALAASMPVTCNTFGSITNCY
jgi:hypothetical protein